MQTFPTINLRFQINPINNKGWEGTGVLPHVEVQEDALKIAIKLALAAK